MKRRYWQRYSLDTTQNTENLSSIVLIEILGTWHLCSADTVRFARIGHEERQWDLCKNGVEDANHFLYKCNSLSSIRGEYSELLAKSNIFDQPYLCGSYVEKLWNKRQQILYKV